MNVLSRADRIPAPLGREHQQSLRYRRRSCRGVGGLSVRALGRLRSWWVAPVARNQGGSGERDRWKSLL